MKYLKWIFLVIALIILDQGLKLLVHFYFPTALTENSGIAFGLPVPLPEIFTILILAFFLFLFLTLLF